MVTTLNFKDIIDLPKWRPLATPINIAGTGNAIVSDLRNNEDRHPFIFNAVSSFGTTALAEYNTKNDEWNTLSFATGLTTPVTSMVIMPAQGPRGSLVASPDASTIILLSPLPASVGVNQLANRGDGIGFKIRIIGLSFPASSGKTEEKYIIANTGGLTPTITLDSPLSFVPLAADTYEFLSGKVYMLGTSNAFGSFVSYDIATNSFAILSAAGLSFIAWTESIMVGLDELQVPYDKNPGEGYFGILIATATGVASLTGQAIGGDAGVLLDEYRNFQIRIVEDLVNTTAVGQRVNIITHTAGPSPVYTVPAWGIVPSATAKYVIENNGDRILALLAGDINTYTYQIATNVWDASITFTFRPFPAPGTGLMAAHAFSIEPDPVKNARHSFIFFPRGGFGTTDIDLFDIAGAATGLWTSSIIYGHSGATTFGSGASAGHEPATNQGRYMYISPAGQNRFYRFDLKNRVLEPSTFIVEISGASFTSSKQVAHTLFIDGGTKLAFVVFNPFSTTLGINFMLSLSIQR